MVRRNTSSFGLRERRIPSSPLRAWASRIRVFPGKRRKPRTPSSRWPCRRPWHRLAPTPIAPGHKKGCGLQIAAWRLGRESKGICGLACFTKLQIRQALHIGCWITKANDLAGSCIVDRFLRLGRRKRYKSFPPRDKYPLDHRVFRELPGQFLSHRGYQLPVAADTRCQHGERLRLPALVQV